MKEVCAIELVMENCEVLRFQQEDIGTFFISNIQRFVSRRMINLIGEHLKAEELFLQLSAKSNVQGSFNNVWHDEAVTPFERLLQHRDVTAINIYYEDKTEDYVYVNWKGELYENNCYQTGARNKHTGDFYLVISPHTTANHYFKEYLTETETICWDLYEDD